MRRLDPSFRDDRHVGCVRFSKGESIKHKFAKCLVGILATEGVPIEDIVAFFSRFDITVDCVLMEDYAKDTRTKDNQDFIQEAKFRHEHNMKSRRVDHWQIALDKILEIETEKQINKKGAITLHLNYKGD
jgi:hypothetical protein